MVDQPPSGWRDTKFGDLCQRIVNGGTPDTDSPGFWNGTTPWITGADFTSKGIGEIRRFVSDAGIRASATSVVKAGNLLVVTRTGVGKLAIAPFDIAISQDITGLYLDRAKSDSVFIFHLLSRELDELKKLNQGTSITGIIRADLEKHPIRVPTSKAAQQKIAAVLTSLDATIEKSEALIKKHERIKAGLMHDLFTRGVLPNGRLRPLSEQAPGLYQETTVGLIPREWNICSLSSLVSSDITYGIVQAGPHVEGGIPYIRTGDMSGERLDRYQMLCTNRQVADSYKRSEVRSADIVMAIRATVGKVLAVPPDLDGANLTQGTAKIAAIEGVDRRFLLWAMRHRRFQQSVLAAIKGTTFAEITLAALRRLPLAIPISKTEQSSIAQRLDQCDDMIHIERRQRTKLQRQKQGLMQDLLTGKVPVKADEATTSV